ncbi:helix-turn-helix domain-containing protein [Marinicella gelatinilytica]|uniref:helix-turn-helix domain-containing protein n=1 Tax=Marinicella gelatinilytica TaxID=2996017 RepID=UPI002260C59E|nr:helix-turn-helix domain-containing protein [Marinicella gelatinilytica]MCX7544494.1 helix-turn-helix domain-containing protein [Marinicella gelatinilytica]
MKKQDIQQVVKAVEKDMAQQCPDLAGALGEMLARKAKVIHTPEQLKIIATRKRLNLTQSEFSKKINTPLGTLRDWEQGISQPNGAAIVLADLLNKNPELIEDVHANA